MFYKKTIWTKLCDIKVKREYMLGIYFIAVTINFGQLAFGNPWLFLLNFLMAPAIFTLLKDKTPLTKLFC